MDDLARLMVDPNLVAARKSWGLYHKSYGIANISRLMTGIIITHPSIFSDLTENVTVSRVTVILIFKITQAYYPTASTATNDQLTLQYARPELAPGTQGRSRYAADPSLLKLVAAQTLPGA